MVIKHFKYGLVSLLAVLFIYAACGYNFAKYCCSTCEAEGIEALINEPCHNTDASCCTNHHEESNNNECSTSGCEQKDCQLYHLKVDESILLSEENKISPKQLIGLIFYANVFVLDIFKDSNFLGKTIDPPDKPNPLAGRTMLSSNCILRI